jgi:hypothetical protein
MFAYLLIYGNIYLRTTFSFLENVMLDIKCTSVLLEHWSSLKVAYSFDQ